ncbi:Uma2 family endonuclease [Pyxidicoccus xibeiensis]|uniref:Uma2 family endonuclease n=1 Tax=Pyxidicoccus xibeiensis TaxID=2906759 RepID=UPI0020A7ABE3|nr:Uma2 family endonuclease [Pyxidicoccus xibeiensis]MCP3137140.1 Uma2 family endonuclease [Pyxidicoccus xibeiensis]
MPSDLTNAFLAFPGRRWTPEEYDALVRSGILAEDERVELLEGVLVPMTPPGPAHTAFIAWLNSALVAATQGKSLVSPQSPLDCGESRPQPDLAVIPLSEVRTDRLPRKALLVVEVADSSLARDRLKAAIYARAGIPEYWLVDVAARTVEVHTEPTARREARYRTVHLLGVEDVLTTPALPKLKHSLATLFGRGRH